MKYSLYIATALVSAALVGCGSVTDAINDSINPDDTSSASYTKTANASGGFDLNFVIENSEVGVYSYDIGSQTETKNTSVKDGSATVNYNLTTVSDLKYLTYKTGTLSCSPINEEAYTCTDNAGTYSLKPKSAASGGNELYLYKCKQTLAYDASSFTTTTTRTCEQTTTTFKLSE